MTRRKYSKEEMARRGDELYDQRVRPHVNEEADRENFVAIDVETGDWALGADELEAADRLEEHRPEAQIWFRRVGSRYAVHFSGRSLEGAQ